MQGFPEDLKEFITKDNEVTCKKHSLKLDYNSFNFNQVINELLPSGCEIPKIYEVLSHVAIFNLSEDVLPMKKLIAEVYVDKNPLIKSILNRKLIFPDPDSGSPDVKSSEIEIIGGNSDTNISISEDNVQLQMDIAKCKYNSRFSEERNEVMAYVNMNYTLCDLCADVGPFTIKSALKGCKVIAGCPNLEVKQMLENNVKKNKVQKNVKIIEKNGEDLLELILTKSKSLSSEFQTFNLLYISDPIDPFKYISLFLRLLKKQCTNMMTKWSMQNTPKVYFYSINSEKDTSKIKENTLKRLNQIFEKETGQKFEDKYLIVHKMKKYIFLNKRLSAFYFRVPAKAIFPEDLLEMYEENLNSFVDVNVSQTFERLDELRDPLIHNTEEEHKEDRFPNSQDEIEKKEKSFRQTKKHTFPQKKRATPEKSEVSKQYSKNKSQLDFRKKRSEKKIKWR